MYLKTCAFVVFSAICSTAFAHHHPDHRVNVAVYYESLCPDSRKFFTQQLYPSLQSSNLSKYVNLTLVPYGKAETKPSYNFECHHGPDECYGNKIQACALKLINSSNSDLGYNKVAVGFINCLMDKTVRNGSNPPFFPTMDCATLNQVPNLNIIDNCANHTDGSMYLESLGTVTDALQKPLKSVPTIVFNKMYKKEDNDLAQNNFVKALCKYIDGERPAECLRNGVAGGYFGSLMVIAAGYLFGRMF